MAAPSALLRFLVIVKCAPLSDGWTRPPRAVVMRTVLNDRAPSGILGGTDRPGDDTVVLFGAAGHRTRISRR
jgi:hypothetical protein